MESLENIQRPFCRIIQIHENSEVMFSEGVFCIFYHGEILLPVHIATPCKIRRVLGEITQRFPRQDHNATLGQSVGILLDELSRNFCRILSLESPRNSPEMAA